MSGWDDSSFQTTMRLTDVAVRQLMYDTAEKIGAMVLDSSLQLVPRDTDTLASSGFYKVTDSGDDVSIEVGYGGNGDPINPKTHTPASQYMTIVHEDLSVKHPTGQAKYLETAIDQYQDKLGDIFAQEVLSLLR